MLYYKNLFIIIVASLFIIGCSGDGSFDEAGFDEAPPSSGEFIEGGDHGPYGQINWMNAPHFWEGNPSLASITLPGTHDSGTSNYGKFWAPYAKCQDVNINKQLEWGVRFLDLRVGFDGFTNPQICHGSAGHANRSLNQVLLGVRNFLIQYSSECVVLLFDDEYNEGKRLIDAIEALLYNNDYRDYVYDKPDIPHLNDARGKMIYWRRYDYSLVGRGLKVPIFKKYLLFPLYENAYLSTQDNYECSDKEKWKDVEDFLGIALRSAGEVPPIVNLIISFTSYYHGIPLPRLTATFMNPKIKNYISKYQRANGGWPIHLGIIASDFVSQDLAHRMLCTNFIRHY
jgi:1-phosphatidylinositol phosphodiesterase